MQDTFVILNPAARCERGCRWRSRVEQLAGAAVVCATSFIGEAKTLAERAAREGFRKIVAAGGDGTINEVVNGLSGSDVALGVLPIGTVNVFAGELQLPVGRLEQCWEIICAGKTRQVDLAEANTRRFVQLAGVGLDAQAVKETSAALKRNFGPLSYLISAAQIASRPSPRLAIESPNASAREASLVLIGNGRFYGGPFPFFKRAVVDDGLLDVLVFKRLRYLEIIRCLQDVVFGSRITGADVEYFQTEHLRVDSEQDVPVEADGELIGTCPVAFRVRRQALQVLVPAA